MHPDLLYTTMDEEPPLSFVRTSADTNKFDPKSPLSWEDNEGDDYSMIEIDSPDSFSMELPQITPTSQQDLEHDHDLDHNLENAREAAALRARLIWQTKQTSINYPEDHLDGLDSLRTQLTTFEESLTVFPSSASQSTGVAKSHPVANSAKESLRNPPEEECNMPGFFTPNSEQLAPAAHKRPRVQNQPAPQHPQANTATSPSSSTVTVTEKGFQAAEATPRCYKDAPGQTCAHCRCLRRCASRIPATQVLDI
ncbi:hypothetical protein DFH06DRAFT_598920 [Mycena polygramma]|nr:hypothetical protein DFH06DRAFT_598920 [Mycena polygramma]